MSAVGRELLFLMCWSVPITSKNDVLTALSFSRENRHPSLNPNDSMISLWFQKGVWRNSVGTYSGYLRLQLTWELWAVDVRNVPNGPRNLCSNFTTARRKKVATMNSFIGVNVNLPRKEKGSSACMKLNHLNSLGAEYSFNFLIKCHYCQW